MKLHRASAKSIMQRISAVSVTSANKWGRLTPAPMLGHLRRSLEISLGQTSAKDESTMLSRTLIRFLALYLLPIPRGRIKAPDIFFPPGTTDLIAEQKMLFAKLEEFLLAAEAKPHRRTVHPYFGRLSLKQWSHVHWKHFDHHLRQFGL